MEDLMSTLGPAKPARFLVESDSEGSDLDEQEDYKRHSSDSKGAKNVPPKIVFSPRISTQSKQITIVLQDAEIWTAGLHTDHTESTLLCDGEEIGKLSQAREALLMLAVSHVSPQNLRPIVGTILGELRPERLQIVSTYSIDNYLPRNSAPCIRTLQTGNFASSKSLPTFDVPNLVTGMAASLLSASVELAFDVRLVLLPSSRSAIGFEQSRPDGIYDPVPDDGTKQDNFDPVQARALENEGLLQLEWQESLGWKQSAIRTRSPSKDWDWAKAARKLRERRHREDRELGQMYM